MPAGAAAGVAAAGGSGGVAATAPTTTSDADGDDARRRGPVRQRARPTAATPADGPTRPARRGDPAGAGAAGAPRRRRRGRERRPAEHRRARPRARRRRRRRRPGRQGLDPARSQAPAPPRRARRPAGAARRSSPRPSSWPAAKRSTGSWRSGRTATAPRSPSSRTTSSSSTTSPGPARRPTSATSTSAGCRTCCRRWRRRSSTSARAATASSTPARSTGTPPAWRASPAPIEQAMKSGDPVLVQVTKDPIGHKGARLTSQISLPGRFLVYVPGGGMTGISRRLPDTERHRLKSILKKIVPEDAGVIVRTAAEGASEEDLTRDVERLQAQWESIRGQGQADGGCPDPGARRARPRDPGRPRRLQRGLQASSSSRATSAWDDDRRSTSAASPRTWPSGCRGTPATATSSASCGSTSS